MQRFLRPLVAAVLLLAATHHASAAFVAQDSAFGANTLVRDTTTDNTWLRLDLTYNLSYEQVTAGLGQGGVYDGFRVASSDEMLALFADGGFIVNGSPDVATYTPEREAANAAFVQIFGGLPTGDGSGSIGTRGRYDSAFTPFQQAVAAAYYTPGSVGGAYDSAFVPEGFIDSTSPYVGTWLIAPAVPEPTTYALMFGGLLAIGAMRRRKSQD